MRICTPIYLISLVALVFACDYPSVNHIDPGGDSELPFGVQEWGFKTGKINGEGPLPLVGEVVDLDTMPALFVPFQGPNRVMPSRTEVREELQIETIELKGPPVVIEPGKLGVPPPDTLKLSIREVDFHVREPVIAGQPRFKEDHIKNIRYYTKEQGLASNAIHSLFMDSQGIMWMNTNAGVSTFDGYQFKTIESPFLSNVNAFIQEDAKQNIWIAESNGRVFFFERGRLKTFADSTIHEFPRINCISDDSEGNVWVGTYNGMYKFTEDFTCIYYSSIHGLRDSSISDIQPADSGGVLIGSHTGLTIFRDNRFIQIPMGEARQTNRVNAIREDAEGNIWFGGYHKLFCISDDDFTRVRSFELEGVNEVREIRNSPEGQLLLATDRGLGVLHNNSLTFEDMESGMYYSNRVFCMTYDECHNIWTGGGTNGLHCIKQGGFNQIVDQYGLGGQSVSAILEDSRGNIWYGVTNPNFGASLVMFDGSEYLEFTGKSGLGDLEIIWDIEEDKDGKIIIASYDLSPGDFLPEDGLVIKFNYYDESPGFAFHRIEEGELIDRVVHTLFRDRDGTTWVGYKLGFGSYDGSLFTSYRNIQRMPDKVPSQWNNTKEIIQDRDGNLWIGSHYCVSILKGNEIRHLAGIDELSMSWVMDLHEDREGRIWVLTSRNGVFVLAPGSFYQDSIEYFHLEFGDSPNDNIMKTITEDSLGRIWIAARDNVYLVAPQSDSKGTFENDSPGRLSDGFRIYDFDYLEGIQRSFFPYEAICLTRESVLQWGVNRGIVTLDLNTFKLPETPPHVTLSNLEIQGQSVDYRRIHNDEYAATLPFGKILQGKMPENDTIDLFENYPSYIKLPYALNHVGFEFSAIDWNAPHAIRYSYMLEGFNENWSTPSRETNAQFTNLLPGDYTFRVKAFGMAQVWSEPFSYHFSVRPPWWLTWWALSGYIIAISALILSIYRIQLRRRLAVGEAKNLREMSQLKNRFYTNITHEFRTPLTVITGVADRLMNTASSDMVEGLESINRNGQYLLTLVNRMLELRKLETGMLDVHPIQDDIIPFIEFIIQQFESMAVAKGVDVHFLKEDHTIQMDFDPEKMTQILSNLISNAVKFTPSNGHIYISAEVKEAVGQSKSLHLKVEDTGVGIPQDKISRIFDRFYQVDDSPVRQAEGTGIGLALTRELSELLGGTIRVQSRAGEGTAFYTTFPITQNAIKTPFQTVLSGSTIVPGHREGLKNMKDQLLEQHVADEDAPLLLIVEDNEDVIQYIASCLHDSYRLILAGNGEEGTRIAIEQVPDLVISDVMMPVKSGIELVQDLKEDNRTSHIPIILLTAKADFESKLEGLGEGADVYLIKPFKAEELLVRIMNLLENRRKLQRYYLALSQGNQITSELQAIGDGDKKEDKFLMQVRQVINEHLTDYDFNVEALSSAVHLSQSQLNRKLKALTDLSANKFIRIIRLSHAQHLLKTSDEPVTAVAYDSGFKDPDYFSRVFKKELGLTPTEYREQ